MSCKLFGKGGITMPFYLDGIDVVPEVSGLKSVLIVPCRFCPAASLAVRESEPYIDFPRGGLETAPYERLINKTKQSIEAQGVNVSVFRSKLLHQFVLCMWTSKRRRKLEELAKQYDALVVMGCEGAVQTVREAVKSTGCRVIPGMKNEGLMSIRPRLSMPCAISLELESVTPILLEQPS
jgi:hypothetical protein